MKHITYLGKLQALQEQQLQTQETSPNDFPNLPSMLAYKMSRYLNLTFYLEEAMSSGQCTLILLDLTKYELPFV